MEFMTDEYKCLTNIKVQADKGGAVSSPGEVGGDGGLREEGLASTPAPRLGAA